MMQMGMYHKARSARISLGTVPSNCSLITELSGKEIRDNIMPAKVSPKPLTALSAKLRAEKRIPSSLLPVLSCMSSTRSISIEANVAKTIIPADTLITTCIQRVGSKYGLPFSGKSEVPYVRSQNLRAKGSAAKIIWKAQIYITVFFLPNLSVKKGAANIAIIGAR